MALDIDDFVRRRLAEQDGPWRDEVGVHEAALERGLALLHNAWGCSWGLDASGRVWRIEWGDDTGDPCAVFLETDPRFQAAALFQASKVYPGLSELVPARPEDAHICPGCDGRGVCAVAERLERLTGRSSLVCYCGGLGWLPRGTQIPGVRLR